MSSEPAVVLAFASKKLMNLNPTTSEPVDVTNAAKKKCLGVQEYIQSLLPAKCRLLGVVADGIVGKQY